MSRIPTYKQRKAWIEASRAAVEASRNERAEPTQLRRSRYGFSPTTSNLTTTEVTLRRASNQKTRRKPSMPKMPWEDTKA